MGDDFGNATGIDRLLVSSRLPTPNFTLSGNDDCWSCHIRLSSTYRQKIGTFMSKCRQKKRNFYVKMSAKKVLQCQNIGQILLMLGFLGYLREIEPDSQLFWPARGICYTLRIGLGCARVSCLQFSRPNLQRFTRYLCTYELRILVSYENVRIFLSVFGPARTCNY